MSSQKFFKKSLVTAVAAVCLPVMSLGLVSNVSAEEMASPLSASFTIASKYIWRGQSASNSSPAIQGSLDYGHASGFHANLWTSSEGFTGSAETDTTIGFGGEVGGISYDIGHNFYLYPENDDIDLFDLAVSEAYLNVGAGPGSATVFVNPDSKDLYVSLDASMGAFGVHGGATVPDEGDKSYDVGVSYSFNDNISFQVATTLETADDDILVAVSYSLPVDLK